MLYLIVLAFIFKAKVMCFILKCLSSGFTHTICKTVILRYQINHKINNDHKILGQLQYCVFGLNQILLRRNLCVSMVVLYCCMF